MKKVQQMKVKAVLMVRMAKMQAKYRVQSAAAWYIRNHEWIEVTPDVLETITTSLGLK